MNFVPKMDRRSFFIGTAAVGGGMALGLDFGAGPQVVRAADGSPEVGVWVVIQPDDTVVIRIARSEMGQGIADRSCPARCRGAGMRLVEGHDRISDTRAKRRGASAPGALSPRPAAAASVSRKNTCAKAAPPPASC